MTTVCWHDEHFEGIGFDGDAIVVRIRGHLDRRRIIRCDGYIGLSMGAVWDEGVIESGVLLDRHPLLDRWLAELAARPGHDFDDVANPSRNERTWRALVITLIDGCKIEIAAARFAVT